MGAAAGIPARARAACTRAWRVRSYSGKIPPPAGGSRATIGSACSVPDSDQTTSTSSVSLEYPDDGLRSGATRTPSAAGHDRAQPADEAHVHRVQVPLPGGDGHAPFLTPNLPSPDLMDRTSWSRQQVLAAVGRELVLERGDVGGGQEPEPAGAGGATTPDRRVPPLGAQRELVDLVRAGHREVLDDAHVARRPLGAEVALLGEERANASGSNVAPGSSSIAAITWSPVPAVGHGVHGDAVDARERGPRMRSIGAAAKFSPSTRIQSALRPAN